jgi:hypothetical protein
MGQDPMMDPLLCEASSGGDTYTDQQPLKVGQDMFWFPLMKMMRNISGSVIHKASGGLLAQIAIFVLETPAAKLFADASVYVYGMVFIAL